MNYFVGIDIGTTHTKAIVITTDGVVFYETKQTYDIVRPQPGYEEQDVSVIFNSVVSVLEKAFKSIPDKRQIAAVGFSAAMHSLLPVDENGHPLHNAIIWSDIRSKKEAEEISRSKHAAAILNNTGIPFHPMSPLCKIAWFKNQHPEIFSKAQKFVSIKEYVFYHFFGKYIVDHSIAFATGLFNIYEKKWDKTTLRVIGLKEEKLSLPIPTTHTEYKLTGRYAQQFGIKGKMPFVIGASDGCLANLGSGAVNNGDTVLTIGTSGAVRMTIDKFPSSNDHHLFTYPIADGLYVRGGAINNGGIILKWLTDLFSPGEKQSAGSYEKILSDARQVEAGANGLIFLPYLLGERAPIWDADAKGVLIGLTMQHKKEHIVRAALEGICFTLLHIIKELESKNGTIDEILVTGGFVQSSFWIQLLSDITGKKLNVTEMSDASATGAACLAMHATGYLNDFSQVKQFASINKSYEPTSALTKFYRERFELFVSLYPKLKNSFTSLD